MPTPYFEAEKEDDPCKVVYLKERRSDPQIVVGLPVDLNPVGLKFVVGSRVTAPGDLASCLH